MSKLDLIINFNPKIQVTEVIPSITGRSAYQLAVIQGFEGTVVEWLASLNGAKIQLRQTETDIEWKYETDVDWLILLSLEDIRGPKGDIINHEWIGTSLKLENPDGSWGFPIDLKGEKGDGSYIYIAYASNSSGDDFTTTFNTNLDYIAIKTVDIPIMIPQASDFTGLWKNYKGETGAIGETGKSSYQIWLDEGNIGTETTYISSLKGDKGSSFVWKGEYNHTTEYQINDIVFYNGSSYICILDSLNNIPTDTMYWDIHTQKGADGLGAGDMLASIYDPNNKQVDVYDIDNMVESETKKIFTSDEQIKLSGIEENANNYILETHGDDKHSESYAKTSDIPTDINELADSASLLFSKSYTDLIDKPDLFSGDYEDLSNKPTLFSKSYNDLTDKPTIPTQTSELTNNSNFVSSTTTTTIWTGTQAEYDLLTPDLTTLYYIEEV